MPDNLIIDGQRPTLPDGVSFWPDDLPQPLHSGYEFSQPDGRIVSEMDQGPPKIRRGYQNTARRYSLDFIFTRDQLSVFQNFYSVDLQGGLLPVAMVVSDERGIAYSYLVISNELRYRPIARNGTFSLTLSAIEVGRP